MFKHIGRKILAVVGIAAIIGLAGLWSFYNYQQEQTALRQNERTMAKLTESVIRGLEAVMLAGHAEVVQSYADRLKTISEIQDFRILRIDGNEAFRDNATIRKVNERRGKEEFPLREEQQVIRVMEPSHPRFAAAVTSGAKAGAPVIHYEAGPDGHTLLTFLDPIRNGGKCAKCHGKDHPVRGILKLTTSLAPVEREIQATRYQSLIFLLGAVAGITLLTYFLIRRTVVAPILRITQAMANVASGDLSQQVPEVGRDELFEMAKSFNLMAGKLLATYTGLHYEQDKLTTIIQSTREGIVVTEKSGKIVLVNPAAQQLLQKPVDLVVREGFLNLFDDPDNMRKWLDDGHSTIPETIVYKERTLNVYASTILAPDGHISGSAALIRDITEEKRLEEELRKLSTTDGLTGLYNRRHLDQTLEKELSRAQRYKENLSVIMIDVDHFKRFNDLYGHEKGDRVLEAVAQAAQHCLRKTDIACRYGGEEFLLILPSTDQEGAAVVAERIREGIEAMIVEEVKVTVSLGVAAFPESAAPTPEALVGAADKALYDAKRGGRNQVRQAPPATISPPPDKPQE